MPPTRLQRTVLGIALLTLIVLISSVHAGPPLICHGIKVAEGQSLPWGRGPFEKGSYDAARVVKDTVDLLSPDKTVLVRMETLRRATLYIDKDQSRADELLGRLMARALDAEAAGKPDALAYFDAGYLAQCYHQMGVSPSFGPAVTKGMGASAIEGYSWVARAISLPGANAQMDLAAALMTADTRPPEHQAHLKRALAGVTKDSEAEKLLAWIAQIEGSTLEALRAKFGTADASGHR